MENDKSLVDTITEMAKEDINLNREYSLENLKLAAKTFLSSVTQIYSNFIKNNNINLNKAFWALEYKDNEIARQLAITKFNFSNALDKYAQRKIILTYVDRNGKITLYTESGEEYILKQVYYSTGRERFKVGSFKSKRAEAIQEGESNIFETLNKLIQKSAKSKQEVYKTAIKRWGETKKKDQQLSKYYWRSDVNKRRLYASTFFSRGEISEGYVNAVIQEDDKIQNESIDKGLKVLYENYIKGKKDNIKAIVKGDVQIDEQGKISLAVKSFAADTAMIGQYLTIAHTILSMKESDFNLESIAKDLPQVDKYFKSIFKEKENKDFLQELMNDLDKMEKSLTN